MIDTHCHLTFPALAERVESVVASARAAGVQGMITVTTTSGNARANLALAERLDGVWCTAGVHPLYADEPVDWTVIREVIAHPRCVAWGELGLDNHYAEPARSLQDRVLAEQLDLIDRARTEGIDRPIVVHCRKAVDDLLAIFETSGLDPERFVFHCFTGAPDEARRILDFGARISFTGVVTFRNAPEVAAACDLVPLDRMMVETDAPFLSPEPVRTARPNEPQHVVHVARFIAERRGVDYATLEATLDANARAFFGLGDDGA